jgi:ERCC4-related helicase
MKPKGQFLFSSEEGHALCLKILLPLLPFHPHDYQIDGICAALDGKDVMAILPTGSGKTGLFFMYMLVIRELWKNPELYPQKMIPTNPLMVAICPTNYLENQTVSTEIPCMLISFSCT